MNKGNTLGSRIKYVREKLEYIVSDDTRYNQFVGNMFNKLSELHEKMASIDVPKDNNTNSYLGKVDTTYDGAAESLRKLGMNSLAQSINGKDGDVRSSAKHIQISFVKDRITGVKSSFYRLLNTKKFSNKKREGISLNLFIFR